MISTAKRAEEEDRLCAHAAFVVQFRAGTDPACGILRGRVEHVVSGRAARFESLDELLTFIASLLREADTPVG